VEAAAVEGGERRKRTEEDTMSTTTTTQGRPGSRTDRTDRAGCARQRRRARALAVAGATAATYTIWAGAALAGVDLAVRTGTGEQTVGPLAVVLATVVAGLAGWGLLAALERFTRRAATVWTITAAAVLVISLLGPLGATTIGAAATLTALHLAAGGVLIPLLRGSSLRCAPPA
jgi:uncharacterized protein DUF6069